MSTEQAILPSASNLKTLISSQSVPYCYYHQNLEYDAAQPIVAEAEELFKVITDSAGTVTLISYRVTVGVPDGSVDKADSPTLPNIPLLLDIFFQFWPEQPFSETNQATLKAAVHESALRARMLAADLVYHMGGDKARGQFVEIMHHHQSDIDKIEESVDTLSK